MRVSTVSKTRTRTSSSTEEHKVVVATPARSVERRSQLDRIALLTRICALATLALVIAIFTAFQIAGRDNIRTGVHAFGVDLSGMTEAEARIALTEAVDERTSQPLVLTDGDQRWDVSSADLGLTMDVDGALDDAMSEGRSGVGPSRMALLWRLRDDPTEVALDRIAVQGDLLDADLRQLEAEIFQEKIDPSLTLNTTTGPAYVNAQIGRALDVEATRSAILAAMASGEERVALTITETQPAARDEDYSDARQRLDNIWDTPIELVAAGEVWTLGSEQISGWLELNGAEGPGQPATIAINQQWVDDVVNEIAIFTNRAPQSARVWWDVSGNLIKTSEGNPGQRLQWDESRGIIQAAFLGENAANRIDLPVEISNPPALPENLNSLGITSNIGEASTTYGGGLPERMHNIELAASRLNGVIVLPGQTFSFNGEVGPTTVEAGFQIAYGIANDGGQLTTVPSEAGGICQVATTVFQPVFWQGYQINERTTHSYWIPNYASNGYVGLDAAVDAATGLDFKWTNNTATAVLIEAEADGQYFTIRLYGTAPPWSVQVDEPKVENVTEADEEIVYQASDMLPDGQTRKIEGAQDGFDVTVSRHVTENGETRTEQFSTTYGPSRNVVLVGSSHGELPAEYR
ncbi:MAG TPA: VanW family protein [Thermomicrobiales bacterium]|nr:VanW family protein [Thermomicrobiales bacterium]